MQMQGRVDAGNAVYNVHGHVCIFSKVAEFCSQQLNLLHVQSRHEVTLSLVPVSVFSFLLPEQKIIYIYQTICKSISTFLEIILTNSADIVDPEHAPKPL